MRRRGEVRVIDGRNVRIVRRNEPVSHYIFDVAFLLPLDTGEHVEVWAAGGDWYIARASTPGYMPRVGDGATEDAAIRDAMDGTLIAIRVL